jgi:glutathione synthase/RimK-type ligase-like ATP-grasp enzyme
VTIIIMNPMDDVHGQHMTMYLKERGIPYLEMGSPYKHDYTLWDNTLFYDGKPINAPRGLYFRSVMTQAPELFSLEDTEAKYIAQVQFNAFVETIRAWLILLSKRGVRMVNSPVNSSKYIQLQLLQAAGIPIPRTCITSSSEVAKLFIQQVGQAVCKPLPGGSYCRKVNSDFVSSLDELLNEPVIFQEEIPGDDVRVNMLEGEVLSAHRILVREGVLDYRTDEAYHSGNSQYEAIEIPEQVRRFCEQAMRLLGLRFSGIDLRVNGDQFTLIECNSMPAYLDIELKTGAPITTNIVDFLNSGPTVKLQDNYEYSLPISQTDMRSTKTGNTLFDYYNVMKDWAETMIKNNNRITLPLNDDQKAMFAKANGIQVQHMEIEIIQGEAKLLRVW